MKSLFDALAAEGAHVEPETAARAIDYGDMRRQTPRVNFPNDGVAARFDDTAVETAGPAR